MQESSDGGVSREQLVIAARQGFSCPAKLLPPKAGIPGGRRLPALWLDVRGNPLRGGAGSVLGRDAGEVRETGLPFVGATWRGWGVLRLVAAQATIRFRVFGRRAAFWGVKSTFFFSSLAGELVAQSGLGVPVSLSMMVFPDPSAHGSGRSTHAAEGMVLAVC